jgi:hypothetical protein
MTTETFYEKHAILDHTYIPGRLTYQVDSHTKDSAYHHNNYTGKGKGHYKDDWKGGKARKGLEGAERIIRKKGIPISYLFIVHCTVEIVICAGVSGLLFFSSNVTSRESMKYHFSSHGELTFHVLSCDFRVRGIVVHDRIGVCGHHLDRAFHSMFFNWGREGYGMMELGANVHH